MTATSFADFVTIARIAVSTRIDSPGLSPSFEGACVAAWADTGRSVLSLILSCSSRSNRKYRAIILVSEDGGRGLSALAAVIHPPAFASTTLAAYDGWYCFP